MTMDYAFSGFVTTEGLDKYKIVTPVGFIDPREFPTKELAERVVDSWLTHGGYDYWVPATVFRYIDTARLVEASLVLPSPRVLDYDENGTMEVVE